MLLHRCRVTRAPIPGVCACPYRFTHNRSLRKPRYRCDGNPGEARYETIDNAYWLQSNSIAYDPAQFYLPVTVTDPFGNVHTATWDTHALLTVENNGTYGSYESRSELDIEGNALPITDQRSIVTFTYKYDIAGMQAGSNNPDAGAQWILTDTVGKPLRTWDSRDNVTRMVYDVLERATHVYMSGTIPIPSIS